MKLCSSPMTTVAGGFCASGGRTATPGADRAGPMPRKKIAAPAPSKTPSTSMRTYFIYRGSFGYLGLGPYLGLAVGDAVAAGDKVGDGGTVFMFVNNVRSTAAIVFVIAAVLRTL